MKMLVNNQLIHTNNVIQSVEVGIPLRGFAANDQNTSFIFMP